MERDRRTSLNSNLLAEGNFTKIAGMTGTDQSTGAAGTTCIRDTALIFEGSGMRTSLTSGMVVTVLHWDWISTGSQEPVRGRRAR